MNSALSGRTALVTGASSGIGRATAHKLAREGADVAVAARRTERLESLVEELEREHDDRGLVVPTDVRDESAVEEMVETTVDEFGGLDVLVNNAGASRGHGTRIEAFETEDFLLTTETNVDGVFFATRAAAPHLVESDGNLIFVGSFSGENPGEYNPVYSASKYWTRGFAHSVEAQLGPEGVAVTVVQPSNVRTEWSGRDDGVTQKDRFETGEVLEPEDVAESIVFAASQPSTATISEIDVFNRDKLSDPF
jgi:NADP-dependent 3-hydroxy acid dehydrogenase YdfG